MENSIVQFDDTQQGQLATVEMQQSRQVAEVQAAVVMAKNFPRDGNAAFARIMQACKRRSLAERALYSFPRGGSKVEGPSIRLAEALAQAWGNLDFGITELDQRYGESSVMAYAWDLETNVRQTKVFTVKHERKARGQIKKLEDPRDIYEMTANQGARRMRACILGIIPGDVVDEAVQQIRRTLQGGNGEPLDDRVRKIVAAFGEWGVTQGMIAKRLGHNIAAIDETELVQLRGVYNSIRDGMSPARDHFDFGIDDKPAEDIDQLKGRLQSDEKSSRTPRKRINTKAGKSPSKSTNAREPGDDDEEYGLDGGKR